MNLTDKQERFCEEYLKDLNGTQAAIRAGYSETSARQIAADNMSKHDILTRIAELKQARTEETLVDAKYVVLGLKEVAERCMQKKSVMIFNGKYMEQAQEEQEDGKMANVWQFDSHGANKAFELLGRHVGIFEKDNKQATRGIRVIMGKNDSENSEWLPS